MIFKLTKTATHPAMKHPVVQTVEIDAPDLKAALERLTISNENRCNIRNAGKTSWEDSKGGTITLTLEEKKS